MKTLLTTAMISLLSASAYADYLLSIDDGTGEIDHCITSYSFSNNVDSLLRDKLSGLLLYGQDIYSTTETLTNKIWKGKPVYRKIVEYGDISNFANNSNNWHTLPFGIDSIDEITDADVNLSGAHQHYTHYVSSTSQLRYSITKEGFGFVVALPFVTVLNDVNVVLEYTKTTDTQLQTPEELKPTNYIHYVVSGTGMDQVITETTNDKSISIKDGYQFDSVSLSCVIQNN